jgi:anthranilate phosphoribosyltransferase
MTDFTSEAGLRFRYMLRDIAKGKHGARDLSREEASEALAFLISNECDPAQVGAFLTAMRYKGTKLDEYLGFFDTIYDTSTTIRPEVPNLVNANGPYDGRKHFLQLSPAAAIIGSAAGVPMLLHSSDGLPPKNGVTSGKVLEALGIPAMQQPEQVQQNLEKNGFGYLHSRVYCHGIERLRPVREKLFYRSFLHSCEVMLNPGGAKRSLLGAAHIHFMKRFLEVQVAQGVEHALAVQGLDGGDELPLKTIGAVEYRDGRLEQLELSPADYGLKESDLLPCESPEETARLISAAFRGEAEPLHDALIYNGGVRIWLGGRASGIEEGVMLARETLESGRALQQLQRVSSSAE